MLATSHENAIVDAVETGAGMNDETTQQNRRALSQIESDLIKAEDEFVDADKRVKRAERDRDQALEKMSLYQTEIDDAVAALHKRGIAGTKWGRETARIEDSLILSPDDRIKDSTPSKPAGASFKTAVLERSQAVTQEDEDEVAEPVGSETEVHGFRIVKRTAE